MPKMNILRPNFEKRGDGLIDVVVQCGITRDVVMKGKTDKAGYLNSVETGLGTFFSESRQKPWLKGEESGNFFELIDIELDCDGDAANYIAVIKGDGKACHTGARSCFYRSVFGRPLGIPAPKAGKGEERPLIEAEVHERFARFAKVGAPQDVQAYIWNLSNLEYELKERLKEKSRNSHTWRLYSKGTARCAQKVAEEAAEVAIAATCQRKKRVISESADLVYHLQVLLISRGLSIEQVIRELHRRREKSGVEEKASRQS